MGNISRFVEVSEEYLQRRSKGIDGRGFLDATTAPSSRQFRREELSCSFVRYVDHIATVANLGAPVRKQAYMPVVLGDSADRTAIGFELNEEFREGFFNVHGWAPWNYYSELVPLLSG